MPRAVIVEGLLGVGIAIGILRPKSESTTPIILAAGSLRPDSRRRPNPRVPAGVDCWSGRMGALRIAHPFAPLRQAHKPAPTNGWVPAPAGRVGIEKAEPGRWVSSVIQVETLLLKMDCLRDAPGGPCGGRHRTRTCDPCGVIAVLYQLS